MGYWHVADAAATLAALVAAGAMVRQEITEVGPGRSIAVADDPDGNPIGLLQQSRSMVPGPASATVGNLAAARGEGVP